MEEETKSKAKCRTTVSKRDSLVIFGMSLVLFAFIIVRVEIVNRRAGVMEAKLEKRIQRIEEEMLGKVHTIMKEMLQTERNLTTQSTKYSANMEFQENLESVSRQHPRERRNIAPTPGVLSLQQIRQEIDKKFTQGCSTADKLCQTGQQGPKGEKGAFGYPGYKGEKGVPGKRGPRGSKGLTGTHGIRGKQGPTGAQGVKGEKGEEGAAGSSGTKGDIGSMGPPGEKGAPGKTGPHGPLGPKGNQGFRGKQGPTGATGFKGEKGDVGAVGSPGQKGDEGAVGSSGTKGVTGSMGPPGEKGAPGKTGPHGPLGLKGNQGIRGKQGPTGAKGFKGEKGEVGGVGSPGAKGDTGRIGPPGLNGLKGTKGQRGYTGIQGQKGECVVPPKIFVSPESQYVFLNKPATFYCWVQGQSFKKTAWRKLEGNVLREVSTSNGLLHINNVQRSHNGSYLCTVFTNYGVFRAVAILGIKASPILTRQPPPYVYANGGSTVELCCEADGHLVWSRLGTALTSLPFFQQAGCITIINLNRENAGKYICRATNQFGISEATSEVILTGPCEIQSQSFKGCHSGWMLIARFSNKDSKNWMADSGDWWYDRRFASGATTDPSVNADMISPAFWMVKGREFKITRSDDSSHTPLLQTTENCLGGQTFRSKITSYGDFRNGKVWSSNRCLGNCTVQYGGQYKTTDGFQQAECSSNIQSSNKIGFWCDWGGGDGSVMMIGGGGNNCNRADHGIGITETDSASFAAQGSGQPEYDFGYNPAQGGDNSFSSQSYSLNLWIR